MDAALNASDKGIALAKKLNITFDLQSLNFEKFYILKMQKKYEEAYSLIKEIKENVLYDNHTTKQGVLREISQLEGEMGDYKNAYLHLKEFQKISDSVSTYEHEKNIQELETRYRTSEKEKQLLQTQNRIKVQTIVFSAIAVLLLAVIGFVVYGFFQRKKRSAQQLSLLKQQKKTEVAEALLEGEELERSRVAKELHDGLGGRITGLKLKLETASQHSENPVLEEATTQLQTVLNELRQTSRNLMPETLLKSGLENGIHEFLKSMQGENVSIAFQHSNLHEITSKNHQLNIFRIVQELVTNSVRHGNAANILVQISKQGKQLLIDVEDDGKGFDYKSVKRSLGLDSTEMRVKSLNGTVKTISAPNEGTCISITCEL